MKKIKILTSIMAAVSSTAVVMPLASCSCNKNKSVDLATTIKNDTISTFKDLSKKTHRNIWNEQEGFDYIVKAMKDMGITNYAGRDLWTKIPEVQTEITKETGKLPSAEDFPNYGNVWFDIPATTGLENEPKIILQSHMDSQMAFDSPEALLDWTNNGLTVNYDEKTGKLYTNGKVSLGSDGGFGISLLLTLAKHRNDFKHGPIRMLFTAGESEATSGLQAGSELLYYDQSGEEYEGKTYLEEGSLKPFGKTKDEFKYLISFGGNHKNTIYQSCSGIEERQIYDAALALNTTDNLVQSTIESTPMHLYTLSIDKLIGGHSANDIDSKHANALLMMMQTIYNSDSDVLQIISASTQPSAFAIACTANVTFTSSLTLDQLNARKTTVLNAAKAKFTNEDWDNVVFKFTDLGDEAIGETNYTYGLSVDQSRSFCKLFSDSKLKFGATEWFDAEKKNVKTSYNHGGLTLDVDQAGETNSTFELHLIARSSDINHLDVWATDSLDLCKTYLKCFYSGPEAETTLLQHISHIRNNAWVKQENNKLVQLLTNGYKNVNVEPTILDSHGWVETGCYPKIMLQTTTSYALACLGPQIANNHDVLEACYTDSFETMNKTLLYVFEHIKELA